MSDPIPEGYITLIEAYGAHYGRKYGAYPENGSPYLVERQTATQAEIVAAFADRHVQAFVRLPDNGALVRILPLSWRETYHSERVFFQEAINLVKDTPWAAFEGRTPFVEETDFTEWSFAAVAARQTDLDRRFDLSIKSLWTLPMALEWIIWRDLRRVREQWDDFRKNANNLEYADRASLARLVMHSYDGLTDDAPMKPTEAWNQLRETLTAHNVEIWIKEKLTERTHKINIADFAGIRWETDVASADIFLLDALSGSTKYIDIQFKAEDIQLLWPIATAESAPPTAGAITPHAKLKVGSRTHMVSEIIKCHDHARRHGIRGPTKKEFETEIFNAPRELIRQALSTDEVAPYFGHRGRPKGKKNSSRSNELEEFRQILQLAK